MSLSTFPGMIFLMSYNNDLIILFRRESILTRNGKAKVFVSSLMKEAITSNSDLLEQIHDIAMVHA